MTVNRELVRQRRIMDANANRFVAPIGNEIVKIGIIGTYSWVSSGEVPHLHTAGLEQVFQSLYSTVMVAMGGRINIQAKTVNKGLETKSFEEDMHNYAVEFIKQELIRRRIASISETTRNWLVAMVQKGYEDGLGQEAIAKLITKQLPIVSRARARVIARTETHTAANAGAHHAAKQTGLPLRRKWLSVEDSRTRDFGEGDGELDAYNHRSMNGQTVGMDEPFLMPVLGGGVIEAMYPGDPALPGAASINCRCTVAFTASVADLLE